MARRCVCGRLMAAIQEDPRLRTLPLAVRALFLLVAEASARSPVPGVLPFRGTARVSLLVSAPETEVETGLETLVAEGLLRAEGEGLAVPLLAEAAGRAEVARRNGTAGGRPRKGETAAAARDRRQREMVLALPGGAAETQETQAAKPAAPPATTTTGYNHTQSGGGGSPSPARDGVPAWVALGTELAEIAGMDGARGGYDFRPVQGWLEAGIAPGTIREAVRAWAGRDSYQPGRVHTFRYFDAGVREAHARALSCPVQAPAMTPEEEAARMAAIQARISAARRPRFAA